jgi:hypothetical protein
MSRPRPFISLLAILVFSTTGCIKEFTCGCTDFDNGPYYYTVEARTEEAARELCETPGGDCTLQE